MPANMDFVLYFNIIFFSLIGIGFIIGYFRGFRKTLYSLIVTVLFYGLFFLTIEMVINQLWTMNLSFALVYAEGFMPELGSAQTLGEAVFIALENTVGENLGETMTNEAFISFITGLAQFVVKIVYTILYFTIGQILFKMVAGIIRMLFFPASFKKAEENRKLALQKASSKKQRKEFKKQKLSKREVKAFKKQQKREAKLEKRRRLSRAEKKAMAKQKKLDEKALKKRKRKYKKPLVGALIGAAKGTVSAFVTMIVFGGMISIMQSMLTLIPEEVDVNSHLEEALYLNANYTPTMLAAEESTGPFDIPADLQEQLSLVRDAIDGYNNNVFVQNASTIVMTDENYAEAIPLNLYLFDSVFSFTFSEEKIMLRNELNVIAEGGSLLMNSEYMTTNDLSDITQEEIIGLFDAISESRLITNMIPLAIEVGSDYMDVPVEVPVEELYDIDWQAELQTLGAIVAVGFDLVNTAGILDDSVDLETVTIDGEDVSGLFDSLADSELATLAAYVAIEPLLEQMGGDISAIITVPVGLDWADEFRAFGAVAEAVLNTGITVGDLQAGDPMILISALSDLDFTVLLGSDIVSNALKNIFSGDAGIEGLDMIVVPDGTVWFDVYDTDGTLLVAGELRNILLAVNAITDVADGFDFENISFSVIADFTDETIDSIFDSEVLVASISGFVLDMDLGDTPLIIPDSALDQNGYLLAIELKSIAKAATVLVTDLACDEGDTVCEETGFDFAKAFSLSDTSIDTLTTSVILGATLGNIIIDQGGTILTIPNSALTEITVDSIPQDVVSSTEIKKLFQAVSVLGFNDIENMEFDASIIQNLADDTDPTSLDNTKSAKLFGSDIVHATLSQMLFEQTEGIDSVLSVPYFSETNVEIRYYDDENELDYLSTVELDNILQALITLNISDFTAVDSIDLGSLLAEADTLLNSSILHATISSQVFDLGSDTITVPYKDEDGLDVRITVGVVLDGTDTEYIKKSEITNILDSLEILGITDINSFDGTVDLASITEDPANIDTMLTSATLHATISDQLIKLDGDGTINLPFFEEDDITPVRVTVGDVGFETEYIVKDEIKAMIDALDVLDILDIESFDGSVDLSLLSDDTVVDTVLASSAIQATISAQVFDLGDDTIKVPYKDEAGLLVRITVGVVLDGTDTEYIKKSEITNILDSLDILGINDITTFDGTVDLESITSDPANIDTMLSSATLHATISDQLIKLDGDGTIILPFLEQDDLTDVRVTVGDVGFETEYVVKDEIKALIDALDALEILDIESFDGSVDLGLLSDDAVITTVLTSSTIQATISDQLIGLDTDGTINLPYLQEDNLTEVRVLVGTGLTETVYVTKVEIEAMIDAMDILGFTDVETFTGSVDLSLLMVDDNIATVLLSSTIQATISDQLINLDTDGTITLPYLDETGGEVRKKVGALETETEYVLKAEIEAMIDAMDILGFTDVEAFTGTVDLAPLMVGDNKTTVLSSATIHATISQQLIDLDTNETITLPYFAEGGAPVRITVGALETETNYVLKAEIEAMIDAMDILGFSDVEAFTGTVSLAPLMVDDNKTTVLLSATIHATISQQLIDLDFNGTINLPYFKEDNVTEVRIVEGVALDATDTEYVIKTEIETLIDALDILGISDVESFDGSVNITTLTTGTNFDVIISSAMIQATISQQVINLETDPTMTADFAVPYLQQDNVTPVRVTVGVALDGTETEYIKTAELKAMIDGLEILGIDDVQNFSGSIDLTPFFDEVERNNLLLSSIMQATISLQLIELGDETLRIPVQDVDAVPIRVTVGALVTETEYITKSEIGAMFEALEALGFTDINNFSGTIDLNNVYGETNQTIILGSAAMHATISKQMADLPASSLTIPDKDIANQDVKATVLTTEFVVKDEIKAMINVLELLGINDITSFDGSFDFTVLSTEVNQDLLLSSASIHATITGKMLDLDDAVLIVPEFTQDGVGNNIRLSVGGFEFVVKDEIKALIDAFTAMGYNDLDNFPAELDSSQFFSNRSTLLASKSIQITVSDKMLNDTGGELIVPDIYYGTAIAVRIADTYGTYIDLDEINAIFASLEELGLSDFGADSLDFSASALFSSNYDILLASATIHATISHNILLTAEDETTATVGAASLIVPQFFRQSIDVATVATQQMTKDEIKDLLDALDLLGLGDFGGSFDASIITTMTAGELDTMLASGSVHSTIDNMLRDNSNISIPTKAEGTPYAFTMTTADEVKFFILAAQKVISGGDTFTTVSFSPAILAGLSAPDQDVVATSMIARDTLTPAVELYAITKFHVLDASDYEDNDMGSFLTKVALLEVVNLP